MSDVQIKRIHDQPAATDGCRVLVDRLWPRGVKKDDAHLDAWVKDVAPSPDLRTWWNHDPERLAEFAARYRAELTERPESVAAVAALAGLIAQNDGAGKPTTLLYAAHDPKVNHARILAEFLSEEPA